MNTNTNKPMPDSENRTYATIRKIVAVLCYILAALGVLMLIKTEARKWFVMGGDATEANTLIFWISLGWAVGFGFAGSKLWPTTKGKTDGTSN